MQTKNILCEGNKNKSKWWEKMEHATKGDDNVMMCIKSGGGHAIGEYKLKVVKPMC